MQEKTIPVVNNFKGILDNYTDDHQDMKLCIQEFDKALCEKVNKSTMVQVKMELQDEFVRNYDWESLQTRLIEENKERAD